MNLYEENGDEEPQRLLDAPNFGEAFANMWTGGADDGQRDRGQYADWTDLVRELLRARLDTPEDFLPDADLSDPTLRQLVVALVDLGRYQIDAPCNNRFNELRRLRGRIRAAEDLQAGKPSQKRDADDINDLAKAGVDIPALTEELRTRAAQLVMEIERDIGSGQFRDYSSLRRRFADIRDSAAGAKSMEMPFFLARGYVLARSTEHGTRRKHSQAIMARRLEGDVGALRSMMRRAVGRRRPARRVEEDPDDDLE